MIEFTEIGLTNRVLWAVWTSEDRIRCKYAFVSMRDCDLQTAMARCTWSIHDQLEAA